MNTHEPIAIVGIGCRFPGAPDVDSLWRVLSDGIETVADYSEKRFDYLDSVYSEESVRRGLIASRRGGFLPNLDQFDADFFHISRHEAERLDPQQRLVLEVGWEAVEDAGLPADKLAGSKTGVFVGLWTSDYEDCLYENSGGLDFYSSTGGGRYPASGRLAYFLDLRGPNLAVDTACSSSLVAVHLACKSLQRGESEVALAGGVNTILRPEITLIYSASGMLSPEGRCKFGDAAANGYVRSEGAGVLVLKILSRAVADHDSIYALIRGSAVNNDGHSSGLLISPSRDGQQAMLRAAYQDASLDPQVTSYIEAHGTGTSAGDPVEIESIAAVVAGPGRTRPCAIGSIKTNLGHTESAAGVAGIIKVALSMRARTLPASLHFNTPNPSIHWDEKSVTVQSQTESWNSGDRKRIAGVSGFGITGTNAHIVLEEFQEVQNQSAEDQTKAPAADRAELFLLSAHSEKTLENVASSWRDRLSTRANGNSNWPASLADLAYTASTRRTHHDLRCSIVAKNRAELLQRVDAWLRKEDQFYVHSAKRTESAGRIAFIFPGQGGQWPGMALGFIRDEPAFAAAIEKCDQAVFRRTGWHVLEKLRHSPERSFAQIDIIQPVLFSVMVSLAALWRSYGVEPQAVAGHSMGEVAAAVASGALSLDEGAAVICERSALMKGASGRGLMALTELSFDAAQDLIKKYNGRVSVAAQNSLNSTVLSGDADAIEDVVATLEKREIFCRRISVDVASHSFHVEPFCKELPKRIANLQPKKGELPIYSTVTGRVEDGAALNPDYWSLNLRQPVLFHNAIQNLLRDGFDTFIEINAHPVLLQSMEEGIRHSGKDAIAVSSLRRDKEERTEMLDSLGALYVHGVPVDWTKLYPQGTCLRLPTYTWQRERYWLEATRVGNLRARLGRGHPNLGARVDSSIDVGTHLWPVELPAAQDPCDRAALLIELAIAAGKEVLGAEADLSLENLEFDWPSDRELSETFEAQLAARSEPGGEIRLRISSRRNSGWVREFSAVLRQASKSSSKRPSADAQRVPIDDGEKAPLAFVLAHLTKLAAREQSTSTGAPARLVKIDEFIWRSSVDGPAAVRLANLPSSNNGISGARFAYQLEDAESHLVAELRGIEFEFITPSQADPLIYEIQWQEITGSAQNEALEPSRWILFGEDPQLPTELTQELKATRADCAVVATQSGLIEALKSPKTLRGIVFFASTARSDSTEALHVANSIVRVVQATTRHAHSKPPRLWLVTTGAQNLPTDQAESLDASQGPAWGLGRVIAREHPELTATNVDLPLKPNRHDFKAFSGLLRAETDEEQLAIRGTKVFAARFTRPALKPSRRGPGAIHFSPDATYLLTGGTGGIGLELTRWLVTCGAKHIALLSRNAPAAAAESQIQLLRSSGAEIRWFATDISGAAQVAATFGVINAEMPPIRGIFHLAAATDGALISDLNESRLQKVMQPKAAGAWILHKETEKLPLDFFVMFSSVAAALSQPGQASYAAANSYMDALARYRRRLGLVALSIQWGPWTGVGLALEEGAVRSVRAYQEQGIETLPLSTALDVLSNLMQSDATNCLVLPVDWQKFAQSYADENIPSLFRNLPSAGNPHDPTAALPIATSATNLSAALQKIPAGPARRFALEKHLKEVLASILKTPPQRIDFTKPMGSFGVDSLTALRFVRRLAVTADVKLPATAVFNHPTIRLLALEVARRMEITLDAVPDCAGDARDQKPNGNAAVVSSADAQPSPKPTGIDDLTEEDAIRSLLQGGQRD